MWRHLDGWGKATYIVARLRRVCCPRCGIRVEAVPWARKGARLTRPMEHEVFRQGKEASPAAVARNLKLGWKAVFGVIRQAVEAGLQRKRRSWRRIGVEEFAYGCGQQKYITIVWDHRLWRCFR